MYRRILVPLDGSAAGEAVLPLVERLCRGTSSEVVLATIEEPGPLDPGPSFQEESIRFAREYLDERAEALRRRHVQARAVARSGPVLETLMEILREEDLDLVVMATHGRTASASLPFGGVAERLLRSSPVPVLAMPSFAGVPRETIVAAPFGSLLVTTNGSEASRAIVPIAAEVARFFGSRVFLLRVLSSADAKHPAARKGAEHWLRELADQFARLGITTESLLETGDDPVPAILDVAGRRAVGMIAMSTHGRSGLGGTAVGSVTEAVLKASRVPVLMVRAIRPRARRARKPVREGR